MTSLPGPAAGRASTRGSVMHAAFFACAIMAAEDAAPLLRAEDAAPLLRAACACTSMALRTLPAYPTKSKAGRHCLEQAAGERCPQPRAVNSCLSLRIAVCIILGLPPTAGL